MTDPNKQLNINPNNIPSFPEENTPTPFTGVNANNDPGKSVVGNRAENFSNPVQGLNQNPQTADSNPSQFPNTTMAPLSVTIESKKGNSGFGVFVAIGVIVILIIYAAVAYIYFGNRKFAGSTNSTSLLSKNIPIATPVPVFIPENVIIENGNVVYREENTSKILVNKDLYSSTGITGFVKVAVSPDKSRMCFESWPPAPQPAIYYSKVDGSETIQINQYSKNCLWTSDSQKIIYLNTPKGKNSSSIFKFDLAGKSETNLTPDEDNANLKSFEVVGLSADDSKIICNYTEVSSGKTGQCEIDLTNNKLTLF